MSDIEFINIYSQRNHFCNFLKQTLQHPQALVYFTTIKTLFSNKTLESIYFWSHCA